ncbi:hypothetical protein [Lichenicoccus roseus]|uniref:Lipoprotein n=1 Tax=Lichenicoccus roseus TaxID=2683649 RepID=A0A5R9JCB6_9PROT|nr:hypothetical protein [Lichenicoccus roseus]TLU73261.1 hypothetical protein FE263_07570 [Lichenicoccus roseus]
MRSARVMSTMGRAIVVVSMTGLLAGCFSSSGGSAPARPVYVIMPSGAKVPACTDGTAPPCPN